MVQHMKLQIDDATHEFTPLKDFREQHQLPEDFQLAMFEPKDYTGLGSIEQSGTEMNDVRQAMLDSIPQRIKPDELMDFFYKLQAIFRNLLYGINESVGLQEVEVEFAVAGFGDVTQNLHYAIMRGIVAKGEMPPFMQLYGEWLTSTVRVSFNTYDYTHNGQAWKIRTVNHVYGRVGMIIDTGDTVHYVADTALACPAEGFMAQLLSDVAAKVIAAVE